MPDPTKKSNRQLQDQARTARIVELSKKWGVPTNAIFSKAKYHPTDIWTDPKDAILDYREYFTFGPNGQVSQSITDRFENTSRGYSGSAYNFQNSPVPIQPTPTVAVSTPPESLLPQRQFAKGGKMSLRKNKYAAFGDSLQPISFDNPYAVNNQLQNPIPYQPYKYQIPNSEPLRQGLNNVSNYFENEPSNMVPNNASMYGPSFYQSENLLNVDTNQVQQSNYQPLANPYSGSPQGAPKKGGGKFSMPNIRLNTAGPIMALAALVNSTTQESESAEEYVRQARRNSMIQGYNPTPYGNNSQILFADGGKLQPINRKPFYGKKIKK